jgi:hypothetical protein
MAAITQPRSHAAYTGRRYGSFAGRTVTAVDTTLYPSRAGRLGGVQAVLERRGAVRARSDRAGGVRTR